MQILSLEVENVKSYAKAKFDFSEGTNAIVGQNGAGKSTILESIGFALFDSINYRQSDFVREGAKTANVVVAFISSLDQRQYQVIRRCGSSSQYYAFDPVLEMRLCEGKIDVINFLKEHMAVDVSADLDSLFRDAVGVPQGTLTAAFLETAARRKVTFDALLHVEEYRQASDKLRDPARLLRQENQSLEIQIAELKTRLERLPSLEQTVKARESQLQTLQTQLATVEKQLNTTQAKRAELDAIQAQITKLQTEHQQAAQQKANLENQLAVAHNAQAEAERAYLVVQESQAGHDGYLASQEEQKRLMAQQQQCQQLNAKRLEIDKRSALSQAQRTTHQQILQEIIVAEATVISLAPTVAKQLELEEALSTAQQQSARLEDAKKNLAKQQQQVERLEQRLSALSEQQARGTQLSTLHAQANKSIEEFQQRQELHREALARYQAEAETHKEQTRSLEAVTTALCPVCEQPLDEAHRGRMLRRNQERVEALRNSYRQAHQAMQANEAELKAGQAQIQELDSQLRKLPRPEEINAVREELEASQTALQMVDNQVRELVHMPAKVQQLQQQLTALDNPRQRSAVAEESASRRPQIEAQLANAQNEIQSMQTQLTTLDSEIKQFATLDSELEAIKTELSQYEPAYRAVLANQQQAAMLDKRRIEVETLVQEETAVTLKYQELAEELHQSKAQLDVDEYQRVVQEEQDLRSQHTGTETELTFLKEQHERELLEIDNLHKHQDNLAQVQAQMAKVQKQEQVLETVRNLLRQSGPFITKALVRKISYGAAQIFGDIMQNYSRHLTWTEDYGIRLEVDGRERQFSQLSGGEQMSAALSVRLALLREMSDIDIAFFDEPTTNLDETRRESLARQILEVKGFRQLFVISHDDTFEQTTQNIVRVQRVNGISIAHNEQS